VQKFGTGLLQAVKDMARRYDDIVIDAGGADSREVEAALRVSDLAIIPIQPAGLDIWTLGLIDDRIGEAKTFNERLQAFVILNRTSWNPKDNDADEAREAIRSCTNLQLTNVAICDRVAVKRAAPAGLTVSEYKPNDPKAAYEMTQLYGFVFGEN
jgi:chromosome partitioning protein